MTIIATALAALAAVYALAGYLIFRLACFRGKELDWKDPDAVKATQYAPYADIIPMAEQWLQAHNAYDVAITSRDGLRLHGRFVPHENAVGSILLFHGYRSHYLVEFNAIFELYYGLGFNLLLVDQRCHRQSEGKYITFGVKESLDALDWVRWHNEKIGQIPAYLGGLSMGASTVQYAAGRGLPKNVRGITADCGFTSPDEILRHVVSQRIGFSAGWLMPAADLWAWLLADFRLKECDTRTLMARCKVPVLMIHGLADDFVPSHMTQASFDACASEKEIHLVEGAGHGVSYLHDQAHMEQALKAFFLRNLPREEQA